MHETRARKEIESKNRNQRGVKVGANDQTGVVDSMCRIRHVSVSPITHPMQLVVEIVDICFSLLYRKGFREERNG